MLLSWGTLVCTVWSMVTSSTTTVLVGEYPALTNIKLGICLVPNGLGYVLGSILSGKFMDYNYERIETRYRNEHGIPGSIKVKDRPDFP